jgi:hypothetical protein
MLVLSPSVRLGCPLLRVVGVEAVRDVALELGLAVAAITLVVAVAAQLV